MNVKYYLKKGKKDSRIVLCLIYDHTRMLKVSTDHKISPAYWDKEDQQVKESMPGYEELNELLLKLKLDVLKQCRLIKLEGFTDWETIKNKLTSFLKKEDILPVVVKKTDDGRSERIKEIIDKFLNARSAEYKPETARKYYILSSVWQEFEIHRKKAIRVMDLSYPIMEEFRLYMLNTRKNRNDTIYKMLASLKCMIRWMLMNNYPVDRKCLELKQSIKNKYEIVTLSEDEINKLNTIPLAKELSVIRDCFLFMVYTGQRYSDMQQLSPEQIEGDAWVFQSVKTGKHITVPFVGWCKDANKISCINGYRFPQYTQQYFNRALKKICKEAGIIETVTLKRYQGTRTIIVREPKYKLISSHTARRTAVSLLLAKGIPPTVVMKLTGHSDIQTMMRYERTTTDAVVNALSKL